MLDRRADIPARVACVTFADAPLLSAFAREMGIDEDALYGDPQRRLYAALGFGRGSVARVWADPRVWARYAALLGRGRRPRRPGQDTLQLGGDAILDRDGRLTWIHRSRGPTDRPPVGVLVSEARRAASAA